MAERILIVDDEQEIADLVALYLESENFRGAHLLLRRTGAEVRGGRTDRPGHSGRYAAGHERLHPL